MGGVVHTPCADVSDIRVADHAALSEQGEQFLEILWVFFAESCDTLKGVRAKISLAQTWVQGQVSKQRGPQRLVTSWLWLVPVPGCLLWYLVNRSWLMCHFQTRRTSGSQAGNRGWAGGVSSLLVLTLMPPSLADDCVLEQNECSSLNIDCVSCCSCEASKRRSLKNTVWKIISGLIKTQLLVALNKLRWTSDAALWISSQGWRITRFLKACKMSNFSFRAWKNKDFYNPSSADEQNFISVEFRRKKSKDYFFRCSSYSDKFVQYHV